MGEYPDRHHIESLPQVYSEHFVFVVQSLAVQLGAARPAVHRQGGGGEGGVAVVEGGFQPGHVGGAQEPRAAPPPGEAGELGAAHAYKARLAGVGAGRHVYRGGGGGGGSEGGGQGEGGAGAGLGGSEGGGGEENHNSLLESHANLSPLAMLPLSQSEPHYQLVKAAIFSQRQTTEPVQSSAMFPVRLTMVESLISDPSMSVLHHNLTFSLPTPH